MAFGIGGSFPARRRWLLASGWSPPSYTWLEAALGEQLWPAGCRLPAGLQRDPQELFRNLFSRVYFDMGWKLWKVGPEFAAVVSQNHSW